MKRNSLLIAAIAAGIFIGNIGVRAGIPGPPPKEAKIISQEEAAKKYPPPQGKKTYPAGMDAQVANDIGSASHSGFIKSPYSARVYDCRHVGSGTLLLDESVNKVFVRP